MNDNNDSQLNDLDSTYPEINIPEFHSTIPEHLLHNVSMENRFVMENLNIQTQYIKWLCESAIDTNLQVSISGKKDYWAQYGYENFF